MFNKSFRKINKNQLINTTNEKTCVVEVEFSIGVKKYKVVRGMKPGVFEIWINNELQNQFSCTTDQQKYLEQVNIFVNAKIVLLLSRGDWRLRLSRLLSRSRGLLSIIMYKKT